MPSDSTRHATSRFEIQRTPVGQRAPVALAAIGDGLRGWPSIAGLCERCRSFAHDPAGGICGFQLDLARRMHRHERLRSSLDH